MRYKLTVEHRPGMSEQLRWSVDIRRRKNLLDCWWYAGRTHGSTREEAVTKARRLVQHQKDKAAALEHIYV